MKGPLRVERADLYERIWTSPTQTVAKELGISDVALAKICKKLNVPRRREATGRRCATGRE